ncbi:MAG: porin family protein [Bacteroidota bacterium]
MKPLLMMNYRSLCVLLMLFACFTGIPELQAQTEIEEAEIATDETRRFRFGLRASYSRAKYYADTATSDIASDWLVRPGGALTFSYLWGDDYRSQFWLQVEAAYRWLGVTRSEFTGDPDNISADDTVTFFNYREDIHQVSVPVLFRVKIGADKVKPFVSVGPYIGYNFIATRTTNIETRTYPCIRDADGFCVAESGSSNFLYEEEIVEEEIEEDLQDVNPLIAGVLIDLGLSIPLKDHINLKLSGRYTLGLTRIYEEQRNANTRNQQAEFSLGVEF